MRTEPTPLVVPDPCNVKRSQARDIAEALARLLADGRDRVLRLYLSPDGVVGYCTGNSTDQSDFAPLSLVGTYDRNSTAAAIAEDILAMHRERVA